eukprot:g41757.t1
MNRQHEKDNKEVTGPFKRPNLSAAVELTSKPTLLLRKFLVKDSHAGQILNHIAGRIAQNQDQKPCLKGGLGLCCGSWVRGTTKTEYFPQPLELGRLAVSVVRRMVARSLRSSYCISLQMQVKILLRSAKITCRLRVSSKLALENSRAARKIRDIFSMASAAPKFSNASAASCLDSFSSIPLP